MKNKKSSYTIFDRYSKNLKFFLICKEDTLSKDVYLCPLSLTLHTRPNFNCDSEYNLTIEHVPPKSMGGKPVCLLIKKINSTLGHTLDTELLNQYKFKQFMRGDDEHLVDIDMGQIQFRHRSKLKLKLQPDDSGKHLLLFNPGTSNMKKIKKFLSSPNEPKIMRVTITEPHAAPNVRSAGYLRIAYLLAFNKFGYSLIFNKDGSLNKTYDKIRRQILNPEINMIENVPVISNNHQLQDGVYIITSPKKLKSICVVFTLSRNETSESNIVMLPLPTDINFDSYKFYRVYKENPKMVKDIQIAQIRDLEIDQTQSDAYWLLRYIKELQ